MSPAVTPERFEYCGGHIYRYAADGPISGMLGDGAVATRAQALRVSGATALVACGSTGMFGTWPVYLPGGFRCPQRGDDVFNGWMFLELGPDRYLEMPDAA